MGMITIINPSYGSPLVHIVYEGGRKLYPMNEKTRGGEEGRGRERVYVSMKAYNRRVRRNAD